MQQDTIKFFLKYFEEADAEEPFSRFIEMFEPNTLLAHPHLYSLFNFLVADMVEELPHKQLSELVRKFTGTLKHIARGNPLEGPLL